MTNESINSFLEFAVFKLPSIFKSRLEDKSKREEYDDYTSLVFSLPQPLSMEEFCEDVEESFGTTILYRHVRSRQTDFGQSVCAFQEPGTGVMFQMCATTNSRGLITKVDVKIYNSMERMMAELRNELLRMANVPGEFFYHLSEDEFLSYFI